LEGVKSNFVIALHSARFFYLSSCNLVGLGSHCVTYLNSATHTICELKWS
jgi:hypothetical protein